MISAVSALFVVTALGAGLDGGGKITWNRTLDVEGSVRNAARSRRPTMVYFTADW